MIPQTMSNEFHKWALCIRVLSDLSPTLGVTQHMNCDSSDYVN